MEKEKLSKRLKVSFSSSELAKLQSQFLKSDEKTFSGFCRKKLTEKFYYPDIKEFEKVNSTLASAGEKINKIASALNEGVDISEIDLSPLNEVNPILKEINKLKTFFLTRKNPGSG